MLAAVLLLTLLTSGCPERGTLPVCENPRHPGRFYSEFGTMGTDARSTFLTRPCRGLSVS